MGFPKEAVSPLPEEEAEDRKEESQERRREKINGYLAARGLHPLARLGTWQRGEFEIVDVVSCAANRWYAIVEFEVIRPDGRRGQFFMKFAALGAERRGCVIIVMIEERIVFVRQHRPALLVRDESAWTSELPRDCAAAGTMPTLVDRLIARSGADAEQRVPLGVLGHELVPLLTRGLVRSEGITLLGDAPEDTGMSTVVVDYWLLRFRLAEGATFAKLRGTKAWGIRTYPLEEVMGRRRELGITDSHSLTGLLLLYEHLGRIR